MLKIDDLTKIGQTIKPHGVSGEILCSFFSIFDKMPEYFILQDEGIFVPFFVKEYRQRSILQAFVTFCQMEDANYVKTLCQKDIFYDKPLTINQNSKTKMNYFIGFKIIDIKFGDIGTIDHIDESTINALFVVGNILIPVTEDFIIKIDKIKRIIFTNLPEGLLELRNF
jgi:16S rRNA processing protein RimM